VLTAGPVADKSATRYVISFNRVFAVDWPLEPITGSHTMKVLA